MSSEFDRNPDISKTTFKAIKDKPNKFKHKVGSVKEQQHTEKEPKCTFCHGPATTGKRYQFIMSANFGQTGQGSNNKTDPAVTRFMANNKSITLCSHCNNRLNSAGSMTKYLSNMKNQGKLK